MTRSRTNTDKAKPRTRHLGRPAPAKDVHWEIKRPHSIVVQDARADHIYMTDTAQVIPGSISPN